ncbi:Uncharacterized protein TCM_012395 [Theobroma cacao]|uniref:Uncharacterized protein n=1 Tax=Theobroma cacao TaxID=3641 RepID=A0A061FVG3_THECC|nr:Uncharacterized protein TCM_012395 [Theobroma cacao]
MSSLSKSSRIVCAELRLQDTKNKVEFDLYNAFKITIEFCSDYYKTRSWVEGYAVPIYSIGHPSKWDISHNVQEIIVLPPTWRGQVGRPRWKRIPSAREDSRRCRCSQYKSYGHNRQNCLTPFAVPLTNSTPSSTQLTAQRR